MQKALKRIRVKPEKGREILGYAPERIEALKLEGVINATV